MLKAKKFTYETYFIYTSAKAFKIWVIPVNAYYNILQSLDVTSQI